jgi:hypothetical protein
MKKDRPVPIDYRCADGRFQLCSRGVTILHSLSVSSRETEVGNEIESWKAHVLSSSERQEAIGGH